MTITKYGHACLLVETGGARILIDPGGWSSGFESLTDLNAVLITHSHPDHLVPDHVAELLKKNADMAVYTDSDSAAVLLKDGRVPCSEVKAGDSFEIGDVNVSVTGSHHAVVHPDITVITNVGYYFDGFYYPGDNFTEPDRPVKVLALPLSAPWSKVSETAEFVRLVKPEVVVPVHDGFLSKPELYENIVGRLSGSEVEIVHLNAAESHEF